MGKLTTTIKSKLRRGPIVCRHSRNVAEVAPRTPHGCEECLHNEEDWVHLRLCMTCGHVGCGDNSVHRHATQHFLESGHPVVRRYEVDEAPDAPRWYWCYVDEAIVRPRADGRADR